MTSTLHPLFDTDSYKISHWQQYPPGTDGTYLYLESRGGVYLQTLFFGLQYILKQYLCNPFTQEDVQKAARLYANHRLPFNLPGWQYMLDTYGGYLPVKIHAVPEGTVSPTKSILMTVESTDKNCFWLPGWLETTLMRVWYPTTVATVSYDLRRVFNDAFTRASDSLDGAKYSLHDFGSRGVSSQESAGIGGLAHLVSFRGTDTTAALLVAEEFYQQPVEIPAGYSIPASEHSTMTAWGRLREVDAYLNMQITYGPKGVYAVVADSYNYRNAVENLLCGALKNAVQASGATIVIRPDSGDPLEVIRWTLGMLEAHYGSTSNSKGYRVLKNARIIYGDGMTPELIQTCLQEVVNLGYAPETVTYGMGGGLLQKVNRDTQRFALKCSEILIRGKSIPVQKSPVSDRSKASRAGRFDPVEHGLQKVFENGKLLVEDSLENVRRRVRL